MRALPCLIVSLFLVGLVAPLAASADALPTRKEGLWEIETTSADAPGAGKVKHCTDAKTDQMMMKLGKDLSGSMGMKCTNSDIRKEGSGFVSEVSCDMGITKMTSKSIFSGDFETTYTTTTETSYDPPLMGRSGQKMTATARWLGPCESGQKPGDVIMANGQTMNLASGKMPWNQMAR